MFRAANDKLISYIDSNRSGNQLITNSNISKLIYLRERHIIHGQGRITGRMGQGILLSTNPVTSNNTQQTQTYTSLSLYRYKAAVKKCRKEEWYGRNLHER